MNALESGEVIDARSELVKRRGGVPRLWMRDCPSGPGSCCLEIRAIWRSEPKIRAKDMCISGGTEILPR